MLFPFRGCPFVRCLCRWSAFTEGPGHVALTWFLLLWWPQNYGEAIACLGVAPGTDLPGSGPRSAVHWVWNLRQVCSSLVFVQCFIFKMGAMVVCTSHVCYNMNKFIYMTCAEWSPAHNRSSLICFWPQHSLLKFYAFHIVRHTILLDSSSSPRGKASGCTKP